MQKYTALLLASLSTLAYAAQPTPEMRLHNQIGMSFVPVKAGESFMGSPEADVDWQVAEPKQ